MLVRAIETADLQHEVLSEGDRLYASRSARELAQWKASETGASLTSADFLQQRAEQLLRRIAERTPVFAPMIQERKLAGKLGVLLPCLALFLGAFADRITDPHRVDLLSAPLLMIILWNLLVYVGLLVSALPGLPPLLPRMPWPWQDLASSLTGHPRKRPGKMSAVLWSSLLAFLKDWAILGRSLHGARVARAIHLSAALFATGAILSLYARGILSQYAAGWESTFLNAPQVHGLLSVLFAPARVVFRLPGFSLSEIEALRFVPGAAQPAVQAGARWVHLYAATLLLVIAPRLALAAWAHWQAGKLRRDFPIPLDQPYFRRLTAFLGARAVLLRVFPYSFTLSEAQNRGLWALAVTVFGEQARVMLRPSSSYGEDARNLWPRETGDACGRDRGKDRGNNRGNDRGNDQGKNGGDAEARVITVVLFSLAATPEPQNHGAFLQQVAQASPRPIIAMVDESGYLERIGHQAGGQRRLDERIALWYEFCRFYKVNASIVNLLDAPARQADLETALAASETQ